MTEHKPVLIIVAGPNGSGKTTVTRKILHHQWLEDSVYINPDNVAQEMFGDWNSDEAVLKAARYCEEWRQKCLNVEAQLLIRYIDGKIGKKYIQQLPEWAKQIVGE